jgi:hypothetical protein
VRSGFGSQLNLYILNKTWFLSCDRILKQAIYVPGFSTSQNRVAPFQTQPNIHVDETPWSVKGIKEWLWVVANSEFCLFTAADTRSRAELETIG